MTKTKTPFFSMGSRGTIGDTITSQKRGSSTLLREKPIPAYRRTLPQVYQRWLYEDYCYLWRQQNAATRQAYSTLGSRCHLTGFQYWMRYQLNNLPDIAGYWKLDARDAVTAHDSSRQANHGTVIGAAPATGVIDGALSFDGINDYVEVPYSATLDFGEADPFTLEIILWGDSTAIGNLNIYLTNRTVRGYSMRTSVGTGHVLCYIGTQPFTAAINIMDDAWHHLALVKGYDTNKVALFVDGLLENVPPVYAGGNCLDPGKVYIGSHQPVSLPFKGLLDQAVIYNRALDSTEIQRHAERRYPA